MTTTTRVDHEDGATIQKWAGFHVPDDSMCFASSFWEQIRFVRDELAVVLCGTYERWCSYPVRVVGTHTSKSIELPVYSLLIPGKGEIRLRYNMHNWVVSVSLGKAVVDCFLDLFDRNAQQLLVYSEGFEARWIFPPYAENQATFSLTVSDSYQLYVFCYLLAVELGLRDGSV